MKKTKIPGKIVVCGGHDTFLKSLRSQIDGRIYYIDRERSFGSEVIKGADKVWIQPNAICHGSEARVLKYARLGNIPVGYFKYASARKCVMQMTGGIK